MMKILLLVALFVLTLNLHGCGSGDEEGSSLPELEFSILNSNLFIENGMFTSKGSKVITSQSEYETELMVYSSETADTLDFSEGQVLLVDMGLRSTGGHSIDVINITVHSNHVVATVVLSMPGANCLITPANTNPYQFVWVPNQSEILITEKLVTVDCVL